jgi:CDP-diacylglycerol--serine O-phosphatidyltransferase
VDFRKTYYILPNLFTLSSVLCGFASLALSASGRSGADLYLAALAICFGLFFDTFDGRVARLTKTQTDLGAISIRWPTSSPSAPPRPCWCTSGA